MEFIDVDADRNLAMKSEAQRLLAVIIDHAVRVGETGRVSLSVDIHRGQVGKATGLRQVEVQSVVDPGNGRLVEKGR